MNDQLNRRSRLVDLQEPFFLLESGESIQGLHIAFETYGCLDNNSENAILLCHALTGSQHAAGRNGRGKAGWWDQLIGPGKALDTDRFFVICPNVIPGCYGSTGPNSINPESGRVYGKDFPEVSIRDIVRAQRKLIEHLGIERLTAVVGGSMGGMQAFEWGVSYPESVERLILIATSPSQSSWRLGVGAVVREALALARSAGDESRGMHLARMMATLTYRSHEEFASRFGREREETGEFAVESYLRYKGNDLVERFDTLTYERLLRGMDWHDIAEGRGVLEEVLGGLSHPALCLGISSDMLYPPWEVEAWSRMIPRGLYREIISDCGHDAFLIEWDQLDRHIRSFLRSTSLTGERRVECEVNSVQPSTILSGKEVNLCQL